MKFLEYISFVSDTGLNDVPNDLPNAHITITCLSNRIQCWAYFEHVMIKHYLVMSRDEEFIDHLISLYDEMMPLDWRSQVLQVYFFPVNLRRHLNMYV